MSKLLLAEVLSSYSAVTRSLNLNMKQVPQDMVFQATVGQKTNATLRRKECL
jgi:hypothetical protein